MAAQCEFSIFTSCRYRLHPVPITNNPQDPTPRGIHRLLSGHKDLVKAVKFLPRHPASQELASSYLLSAGDDKCVKLWKLEGTGVASCVQTVEHHTAPVNCVATVKASRSSSWSPLFATGAADATVAVWRFDGQQIQVLQTIQTNKPRYFPLAVAISPLGDPANNAYILASAGTKDIIQVYTGTVADNEAAADFALSATLTGHEGWIRSLDFTPEGEDDDDEQETTATDGGPRTTSDLLLASASQDKYIRLWRVHRGKELPAQAATASDPTVGAYLPGKSPSNKAHRFRVAGGDGADDDYSVTFESLLFNHDDWIYSAKWHHRRRGGQLQLLSTSADNSLAVWESDPASGIWVTTARLGEISREKGATTATGSIGGFWTGLWAPAGTAGGTTDAAVLTLGRTGAWRRWDWDAARGAWRPALAVSGHTRPVTGVAWAPRGEYLLSTSADQTTRLHAPWRRQQQEEASSSSGSTWHEMARPQIHGYDLNCVDALSATLFVSGADEKLMRVFSMPRAVARMLETVTGKSMVSDETGEAQDGNGSAAAIIDSMPDAANMPVLGLSNKATVEQPDDVDEQAANATAAVNPETSRGGEAVDPAAAVRRSALAPARPPFEEALSRHTLWPEAEKLYGHGYELSCLAASHDGRLVASACRASGLNHAVVRVFETAPRWAELRPPLAAHTLTATRLRFSPDGDGAYLLSVGRDRQWAVFEKKKRRDEVKEGEMPYVLKQKEPKGHARMILDAAWAPPARAGERSRFFATAGRDKSVKFWLKDASSEGGGLFRPTNPVITDEQPVTAVDFLNKPRGGAASDGFVMAAGHEGGKIKIYTLRIGAGGASIDVSNVHTIEPG